MTMAPYTEKGGHIGLSMLSCYTRVNGKAKELCCKGVNDRCKGALPSKSKYAPTTIQPLPIGLTKPIQRLPRTELDIWLQLELNKGAPHLVLSLFLVGNN